MKLSKKVVLTIFGIGTIILPAVFILSLYVLIVLFVWGNTFLYTDDLSTVDSGAYSLAQKISSNPNFTKNSVNFRRDNGSLLTKGYAYVPTLVPIYSRTIFLTPKALKSEYLDVIIAHELGHIQNSHNIFGNKNEEEANQFAARICGDRRVLDFLLPPVK